jgi:molecular chaperone DnaK
LFNFSNSFSNSSLPNVIFSFLINILLFYYSDYIIKAFQKTEGIDLYKEKQALQRIIEASEKAKVELSSLQSTRISLPFIYIDGQTPKHIDLEFDRSKFENLSRNLLERCKKPVQKALEDAKLSKAEIDEVILVGGSTRIPAVRNLLTELLGKPLNETVNPDEVVAMGAAVQAGIIAGEITDLILLDVTPLSLGVETMGGLMTTIINRNASIPVKQSEVFSTGADNQETVEIHVLQGERPFAKDNKSLGIFRLKGIPPSPRGVPKINVTFQLDVNGLLSVSAREEQTGQEQSIKIEGASVLARDEVSQMIKDAEENALFDKSKKSVVNITYELDNLFSKADLLFEKQIISENSVASTYFLELLKESKELYKANDLTKLSADCLKNFKYVYSILVLEFVKKNLMSSKSSNSSKNSSDNIIDVELADES